MILCYGRLKLGMISRFLKAIKPAKQATSASKPPNIFQNNHPRNNVKLLLVPVAPLKSFAVNEIPRAVLLAFNNYSSSQTVLTYATIDGRIVIPPTNSTPTGY